ncbi:MAG: UDP-N-acetylmuramoyl-L-alanine--D-glutamate ligase [Verrucomicrobia subdivision 3 bacterium]|nr:UDP-N-acetylmuramoyl-L-alanine--D-glutamate ligase [Limisphaerales bacterium]
MDWAGKNACVIGLGRSGISAAELLLQQGATVTAVDNTDTCVLQQTAAALTEKGATCRLGVDEIPDAFDLAVISPGVPLALPMVASLRSRGVQIWGEMELGWRFTECPVIAITGTNGKTTTTEWVASLLSQAQCRTVASGNIGTPLCTVVSQTRELDAVTLEVSSFQLETIADFRPAIGVLLNLAPDHLDRHGSMGKYIRAKARLFENQKPIDYAIVQLEALRELEKLDLSPPSKIITFSATDASADLHMDRRLLVSQLPGWPGPLLDLDEWAIDGLHNAENLMATFAVGYCQKISVDKIKATMSRSHVGPHRCEIVAEIGGVRFVNDSKATNVHALCGALQSMPTGNSQKNIWLIAGGQDKGLDFLAAGPEIARRVKGAFLIGEAREQILGDWTLFSPCKTVANLLEAVAEARRKAVPGDVVLLSPACASFDQFDSYEHRGREFCQAIVGLNTGTRTDD